MTATLQRVPSQQSVGPSYVLGFLSPAFPLRIPEKVDSPPRPLTAAKGTRQQRKSLVSTADAARLQKEFYYLPKTLIYHGLWMWSVSDRFPRT